MRRKPQQYRCYTLTQHPGPWSSQADGFIGKDQRKWQKNKTAEQPLPKARQLFLMGHHMPSDSNLRTMAEFFPAQEARVESCLWIVTSQTSAEINILNSRVSDLLGTHVLIKSVFFLLTLKNPLHFESFLKLWLHSVVLLCDVCGAQTQAATFSPKLSRRDHSLLTVWLASPGLHPHSPAISFPSGQPPGAILGLACF